MTTTPTFTVVTVNRNSGDQLATTVNSVFAQRADFEFLVVDGASTDPSRQVVDALAHDSRGHVVVVSEPDAGVYDAMNKAVRLARGRYLYFLNAGDRLRPGVLAKVKEHLPAHDRGFVYGNVVMYGQTYDGPFDAAKICRCNVCHQSIFYGRDVFRLCGGYDVRYRLYADWALNLRCFGSRQVVRRYVPFTIADFASDGLSTPGDPVFLREKARLVRESLGFQRYVRWRLRWALGAAKGYLLARPASAAINRERPDADP